MVIHLITRLPMGGATQLVFDITKRMHESGEEVLILTGVADAASLSAKNNRVLEQVYAAGIPVAVCPYLRDRISTPNDLRALFWLCAKLRMHRAAIVHIHSSKAGILGRLACRVAGVKRVIFHVHGWSFSRSRGLARKLAFLLERAFYHLTDAYVFVCRDDMLEFVRMGGNRGIETKGRVIYPGTVFLSEDERRRHRRELRARLGFTDGDFVIGSIGRLDYQKNPQAFVPIAKRYSEADSTARFIWIGEGRDRGEVEGLIERAGLSGRFTLTGFVEDAEPYFGVLDTFVLTSRYEGLPLSVIKALSCATPVVGFLVNGMNDLHTKFESVLAVAPGDSEAFVKGLATARAMLGTARSMLESEARIVRERMNGDRMYDAIVELYASMGRAGGARADSAPPPGLAASTRDRLS